MNLKKIALTLTLLPLLQWSQAQDVAVVSDLELWNSISITKKLNKSVLFELDNQYRFSKDVSQLDQYFIDLYGQYKINKYVRLGAGYRFARDLDWDDDVMESRQRLYFDAVGKYKIDRLRLTYRFRYQLRTDVGAAAKLDRDPAGAIRNKIGAKYNLKGTKLTPYAGFELFRLYTNEQPGYWSKYRATAGVSRKFKDIGTFKAFYRVEPEINRSYSKTTYILGLGYNFSF